MKLTEFNLKPKMMAKKALKENFNQDVNFNKLSLTNTREMLARVRGLMQESKASASFRSEQDPTYLKLMFMEQALKSHYAELKSLPQYNSRVVLEAEGVEGAQVVLAAKDMVDSVQKMIEDISDMLVKELPAVVDSVNSEIGTDAGEQFNGQATEALSQLGAALQSAKVGLQSALNIVTGGGVQPDAFGAGAEMGGEMGAEPGLGGEEDLGADMGDEVTGFEEPEEELGTGPSVGRGKR